MFDMNVTNTSTLFQDHLPFKKLEYINATCPLEDILQKIETAIEIDHLLIVISDWQLNSEWDKDLFTLEESWNILISLCKAITVS